MAPREIRIRTSSRGGQPASILVKLKSRGAHAVEGCAEGITRRREAFAPHTRDGSRTLDELIERHGIRSFRAAFGRGHAKSSGRGESLRARREKLIQRWRRSRTRNLRAGRRSPQRALSALEELPDLAAVYRVPVPPGADPEAILADLKADPHVAYAQPAASYDLDRLDPDGDDPDQGPVTWGPTVDDPYLASQGSWGQPYADLWGLDRVGAPLVWDFTQGEGVVVAVVDTGLDRFHPDIADNVWVNPGEDLDGDGLATAADANGIDDDRNGFIDDLTGFDFANSVDADGDGFYDGPDDYSDSDPFDDVGHGTHVSGTIAALADNGLGIAGVAPKARIMALKGFPDQGPAPDLLLWRAVLYAAENGASVINNSWSCGRPCPDNPLADDVLSLVEGLGAVVVTSAGNASDDVVFRSPESGSSVITVGALGFDDRLPSFSNRGWLTDVVAPGGGPNEPAAVRVARRNILSLLSSGAHPNYEVFAVADGYVRLSGTSMAAPHVAGAVALLRSLRPELEPRDVRRLLRMSARDLGSEGHDPVYGAGLVDVPSLLEAELPDLELGIEEPSAGVLHDPAQGPVHLRGFASGSDLESLEVSVGRGLAAREFAPLEDFGDSFASQLDDSTFEARWDVADVADGPWVLRVTAVLADGRTTEEHTLVGIERNTPSLLSPGDRDAGFPVLVGEKVMWQVDEETDTPQLHDLAGAPFQTREAFEPVPLVEREGDQRNVRSDGRFAVWTAFDDDGQRVLEACRIDGTEDRCDARRVSNAPGTFVEHRIEQGWLLWMRFDQSAEFLEGCRLVSDPSDCEPRSLLAPGVESGWRLRSFDGRTLLLERFGTLGRCTIEEASALGCDPRPITMAAGAVAPVEPIHDGDLVAFGEVDVEPILPPGCEPGVYTAECLPKLGVVWRYWACWLDADQLCDPIPVSQRVPQDRAWGLDVSGRRVAWSTADDFERAAVRVCEFDAEARRCPGQRLGGGLAYQTHPAIDQNRVVWEDRRSGVVAVWGLELPNLQRPPRKSVRAGRPFAVWLRAANADGETLAFEIESLDGVSALDAGARVRTYGKDGRAVLVRGRLPRDSEGLTRWRLRATGAGGLFSETVIEIDARPELKRPWWWFLFARR